jgi:hypothetical protein
VSAADATGTRQLVYDFFVAYQQRNGGLPPSLEDICRGCYLASRSAAKRHVDALIAEGRLRRIGAGARCIVVAGGRWTPPGEREHEELRGEVLLFALAMERKLRQNDHKGGWKNEWSPRLLERLWEEHVELYAAIETGGDILGEAADIANFAMMIADVEGALEDVKSESRFRSEK